jgi:hypothetical protein
MPNGTTMMIQNSNGVGGGEVLNYGTLTPGATYFFCVRNFNATAVGSFNVCLQHLVPSDPDYGSNYGGLCSAFKCDWNGASIYQVTFVDGPNQYSFSSTNTVIPLTNFVGLQYGHSYQVYINSIFNVAGASPISVMGGPYTVHIAAHQDVDLRLSDQCPTTRIVGAFISADKWICQCVEYEWEFIQVDQNDQIIGLETYYVESNSPTRFMRTSLIPNVQPGNRYRVRIRPVFANGPGEWGSDYQLLCITGAANSVEVTANVDSAVKMQLNASEQLSTGIYPNPNNGEFANISIDGLETDLLKVRIMDTNGRIVYEKEFKEPSAQLFLTFERPLANGIYTIDLLFGDERITEKMMVVK